MSKLNQIQKEIICSINGCTRNCYSKNLCRRHYNQIRKKGYIYGNPKKLKYGEKNRYFIEGGICKIELYDVNGNIKDHAVIDAEDYPKVKDFKWSMDHYGYATWGRRNRKNAKLHQVISGWSRVAHKNGDILNNRKYNLRKCTHQQNTFNCKLSKNNTSGYKGVFWDKSKKKWTSSIKFNYKHIFLGRYENKEDAVMAYNNAAIKYFGDFARLNQTCIQTHEKKRKI